MRQLSFESQHIQLNCTPICKSTLKIIPSNYGSRRHQLQRSLRTGWLRAGLANNEATLGSTGSQAWQAAGVAGRAEGRAEKSHRTMYGDTPPVPLCFVLHLQLFLGAVPEGLLEWRFKGVTHC